ncbi:MAG TPA: glycosyl hydrolase family 88, partial [Draconibacterium sp.]|nr:glycosyl hydrolase family 88 [Draconibacterium sp.]
MKLILATIILGLVFSCSPKPKTTEPEQKPVSWAVQFADAVMTRHDSLINYNENKRSYGYDYAFLGSAIDKLGLTDPKYSDYMKAYIDYFVQNDGSIKSYKMGNYNIDNIRPGN